MTGRKPGPMGGSGARPADAGEAQQKQRIFFLTAGKTANQEAQSAGREGRSKGRETTK